MPLALVLSLGCGGGGNAFTLSFKGAVSASQPIDMQLNLDGEGSGVTNGDNVATNSGMEYQIAPSGIFVGLTEASSHVSGGHCVTSPCPKLAQLSLRGPPSVFYAGPWKATHAVIKFQEAGRDVAGFDFEQPNDFTLNFERPQYSASGDIVFSQNGTVSGRLTYGSSVIETSGTFHLEQQCTKQERSFRRCGQRTVAGTAANPSKQAYLENTCPADLVKPYEVSPTWSGKTLHLGDIAIDCRGTNSTTVTENAPPEVQCFRRTTVQSAGCTWDVFFQTDGLLQAFTVAGFADSACAMKTCNTYR